VARLYADEDVSPALVNCLRTLGHDVTGVVEQRRFGRPDPQVLADAVADGRIVLTHNRPDFEKLHRASAAHPGIISATRDDGNEDALAARIDAALAANPSPAGQHIRVNRPP
jgi:hypothetical protein